MNSPPPPFACTYSPNVAELLTQLNCSIAITTYQAGKLIFLSPDGINAMRQLPRDFDNAMGLAINPERMAIATKHEVVVLANAPELAKGYVTKPDFYDSFFVPRACYYTGTIDIHDMDWDIEGNLWAVNTLFSSLVIIDDQFSFRPQWMPPFIATLESMDACHLNGMCMLNGKPKYATLFGTTTTPKGWRQGVETNGLIMDIDTNEIVAQSLPMPHSPRWFDGNLYCLLSATGQLIKADVHSGKYDVVCQMKGFVRGMAKYGDYIFIGLSKLRQNASTFRDLAISRDAVYCGIDIIHLPSGANVGNIRYLQSVEEIYDIQILPNSLRPGILNHTSGAHRLALHTPRATFWAMGREN
ncbi:MAG TPA: TIGR03032 family protein [Chitinophagaceae bacterium]|nr:TIGR03032 family protein [Chitinophagaceae bacterium]